MISNAGNTEANIFEEPGAGNPHAGSVRGALSDRRLYRDKEAVHVVERQMIRNALKIHGSTHKAATGFRGESTHCVTESQGARHNARVKEFCIRVKIVQ